MKEKTQKSQNTQRTSVYFSPDLHVQIAKSAEKHRRSFNQELLWLIEQGLRVEQQLNSELGIENRPFSNEKDCNVNDTSRQ